MTTSPCSSAFLLSNASFPADSVACLFQLPLYLLNIPFSHGAHQAFTEKTQFGLNNQIMQSIYLSHSEDPCDKSLPWVQAVLRVPAVHACLLSCLLLSLILSVLYSVCLAGHGLPGAFFWQCLHWSLEPHAACQLHFSASAALA